MLLKISIILAAVSVICLAGYVFLTKTKAKQQSVLLKRTVATLALLTAIGAAVFAVIFCRANHIKLFNRLKSYDPVATYTSSVTKDGVDNAFLYLPDSVFSYDGEFYFKNGKNDLFRLETSTTVGEDGSTFESYSAKTVENEVLYVGGCKTLRATITAQKELKLDGYFKYSEYDGQKISFKNKIVAENVEFCALTDNSLVYITTAGDMFVQGFNEYGQLGDTTAKNKDTATLVSSDMSKCAISDTHSMTVDKFGNLSAVGDNSYSQLGNKTAIPTNVPVPIMKGVKDVKVGNFYSVVLTVNGEVLTAGLNEKGQLGNSGEAFKAELVPILTGIQKIDVNGDTCAALTYSGELYVWGDNTSYKAGFAGESILPTPVKIASDVYDFALSSDSVAMISNNRDVLKTSLNGGVTNVTPAITFNAQIPGMYKDNTDPATDATTDAV